jgi:hypothetical protein
MAGNGNPCCAISHILKEAFINSTQHRPWQRKLYMTNLALVHSGACRALIDDGQLEDALRYCAEQGIVPPFSPCLQGTPEYDRCIEQAKEALSDYGWWEKRLKMRTSRSAIAHAG